MAIAVIRKLGLLHLPFALVLCGGLMQNTMIYQHLLVLIRGQCANVMLTAAQDQPICASIRYGLMLVGIQDDVLLNGLSAQINKAIVRAKTFR